MKLFAKIISANEIQIVLEGTQEGEGWYEIEREPDPRTEQLQYDPEKDCVNIVPIPVDKVAEQKATEDAELMKPDTIRNLEGRIAELEKRIMTLELPT